MLVPQKYIAFNIMLAIFIISLCTPQNSHRLELHFNLLICDKIVTEEIACLNGSNGPGNAYII